MTFLMIQPLPPPILLRRWYYAVEAISTLRRRAQGRFSWSAILRIRLLRREFLQLYRRSHNPSWLAATPPAMHKQVPSSLSVTHLLVSHD